MGCKTVLYITSQKPVAAGKYTPNMFNSAIHGSFVNSFNYYAISVFHRVTFVPHIELCDSDMAVTVKISIKQCILHTVIR